MLQIPMSTSAQPQLPMQQAQIYSWKPEATDLQKNKLSWKAKI